MQWIDRLQIARKLHVYIIGSKSNSFVTEVKRNSNKLAYFSKITYPTLLNVEHISLTE